MTSEVKTEARFELSSPSYLLGPDFEAVIGPIEPVKVVKKQMSPKKKEKRDNCPVRPAGSAAGNNNSSIRGAAAGRRQKRGKWIKHHMRPTWGTYARVVTQKSSFARSHHASEREMLSAVIKGRESSNSSDIDNVHNSHGHKICTQWAVGTQQKLQSLL